MFLCLTCPCEEVFFELVIELVEVFFVNFERGEGELSAVYECALEFIVGEVVESESSLFDSFLHEVLDANKISQEAVFALILAFIPTLVDGFMREGAAIYSSF